MDVYTTHGLKSHLFCLFFIALNSFAWQTLFRFLFYTNFLRLDSLQLGLGLSTLFMVHMVCLHGLKKTEQRLMAVPFSRPPMNKISALQIHSSKKIMNSCFISALQSTSQMKTSVHVTLILIF